MSRFEDATESKVYVNNMNTRLPTVDIPNRVSKVKHIKNSGHNGASTAEDARHPSKGGPRQMEAEAPTVNSTAPEEEKTILSNGEDLHQNLESIYGKIMRRLQRELNYEEINRVPLATQFGIVQDENGGMVHRRSQAVVRLSMSDTAEHSDSSPPPLASTTAGGFTSNYNAINRLSKDDTTKLSVTSFRVDRSKKDEVGEIEYSLAQQPCPETLRLVIAHVVQMLVQKLELAARGSLKDALRFTFESKALLDRLLKEIPNYNSFQGNAESLTATQKSAQTQQMHDMFLHFKKIPVVAPQADYARDMKTGAVVAVVDTSSSLLKATSSKIEGMNSSSSIDKDLSSGLPSVGMQPGRSVAPLTTHTMVTQYTAMAEGIMRSAPTPYDEEEDIVLPPGYAKSARVHKQNTEDNSVGGAAGVPSSSTLKTFLEATPPRQGVQSMLVSVTDPPDRSLTREAETPGTGSAHAGLSTSKSLGRLGAVHRGGTRRQEFSESSLRAYQARLTDASTLTVINSTNIVQREDYDRLFEYSKQLEVQVSEARREMNDALEKLVKEKDHTNVRARVIRYLRETLLRECNVLRSQLSMAEQKEHTLQQKLTAATLAANTGMGARLPTDNRSSFSMASAQRRAGPMPSKASKEESDEFSEQGQALMRSSEITKVQSLLDLAFMAVESEGVMSKEEWFSEFPPGPADIHHPKKEMDDMIAVFEQRQRRLKERIIAIKIGHSHTIAAKDREIASLRRLTDLKYVHDTLIESVRDLRHDLRRAKNSIHESLNSFRMILMGSLTTLQNRATLMDKEVQDYVALRNSQGALIDLIRSAKTLFLPMLTTEYAHGYHPWPTKIRNTIDPLAQVVLTQSGPAEVVRLREPLTHFSDLYIAIHKYVTGSLVVPDVSRPSSGKQLAQVCSAMVLSPLATIDLIYNIRLRYDKELQLKKQLARLNFQITWRAHLQRIKTERCVGALLEGQMDPHTTQLPISHMVNRLAESRAQLSRERSALQKERADNAKELYRLWKDKQIDIFEGYAIPMTQNRVALLTNAQVSGARQVGGDAAVRTHPGGSKLLAMNDAVRRSR